ncbi:hypothetical protein SAMN05443549_1011149 [Flavobacterium fluvii]|uniref:TonB-dependent Receptor Plug Domain n=1 Tax=Flavobacterium fluvii TaxID=468056 RepID=A0A1M5G923_9FLAO|nr:hypothetical protein [Flavobacterium fluvii]SHG00178.1 hypothetical protein SAMN05443549_1011149 [Flavobacterium fluvii]
MKFNFTIFGLLLFIQSFSQTTNNQENIKNLVETYFHYDRENIYVQFNKTVYVNNEDLAFKGYVINKNKYLPDVNTTNVQLAIYNDQKKLVQKQLLYTALGVFEGGIHLNEKFSSGKYYFHFYTNWMNNFTEDESFIQTVEIINRNEPYYAQSKEPNWKSAKIEFFPESGKIINSITNKIGVKLTDCNRKGIKIIEGKVFDSKSKLITQFKTNEMGNGSFYLTPDNNEKYTVQIKTEKLNLIENLPSTQNKGLAISYNNNLSNNILAVVVKTNNAGLTLYQNKKLVLLLHQNGNSILKEFTFDANETEKTLRFDKTNLANGVNTIRVIDEGLNEVAERLIYIETDSKPEVTLEAKTIANDSLMLSVKNNSKKSNLSISILPENNTCITNKQSIIGTMRLNAYLDQPENETYPYFDNNNKTRKQDIELAILNQNKNKYLWSNIKSNPPKITYPSTQGITIKGNIEKKLNSNSKYKISLISMKNKVFEESMIDKNNLFTFENIYVHDSTIVLLQMTNEKNIAKNDKINAKVVVRDSTFVFQPKINLLDCPAIDNTNEPFSFAKLGLDKSIINLNDVVIKGDSKKTKLIHKEKNNMAKAFKITDKDFGNFLDYLSMYGGYRTGFSGTNNSVYIKNKLSDIVRDTDASPTVYIDDQEVFDLNFLFNLSIEEVDEIYIDKMGYSNTNPTGSGTIKIYLKNGMKNDIFQSKNASFMVTHGFTKEIDFSNAPFETAKEFNYFGTLSWTPKAEITTNNSFEIKSLKANQKEIQVLLEGFSEDGELISEIRKIPVSNL